MEMPEEFESMSQEERANFFSGQVIDLQEGLDMESLMAMSENMGLSREELLM